MSLQPFAPALPATPLFYQQLAAAHSQKLGRWAAAMGSRHYAPLTAAIIGDSITSGFSPGVTALEQTYPYLAQFMMATRYPTAGVSTLGRGLLPPLLPNTNITPDYVTVTGGAAAQVSGFGWNSLAFDISANAGSQYAYALKGDSAVITYLQQPGGGTFSWQLDAGAVNNVSTAGTLTDGQVAFVNMGAVNVAHTLTVRYVSGTPVTIDGVIEYNGDLNAGIQVFNCGRSGATAATFMNANFGCLSGASVMLVGIELGGNEWTSNISPAVFAANLSTLLAGLRAQMTGPAPCFLLIASPVADTATYAFPWQSYVQQMYAVSAASADVDVLDYSIRLPNEQAGGGPWGLYDPSSKHPSTFGHGWMADVLCTFLGSA